MPGPCSDPTAFTLPTPEQLRERRILARVTLREAAAEVGVDKNTVWRWEQGRSSPRLDDVRALLALYDDQQPRQQQLRV